jgi:hypothetical protein
MRSFPKRLLIINTAYPYQIFHDASKENELIFIKP